ncbi:S9 family peptidase, partial [Burkholderia multivorans]
SDSLTTSSYPRQARALTRGQSIDEAPIVAEVPRDHVAIYVGSDVGGRNVDRAVTVDAIDFFNSRASFIDLDDLRGPDHALPRTASSWEDAWIPVDVPTDVSVGIDDDFVLFRPQSDWDA